MLEKETQKHIRLENLLRMLSESSFIESSIFDLESGFSIVESGFLKRESEHESGFFPSPGFLRVRVQVRVRVRVRSGFRSMPFMSDNRFLLLVNVLRRIWDIAGQTRRTKHQAVLESSKSKKIWLGFCQ